MFLKLGISALSLCVWVVCFGCGSIIRNKGKEALTLLHELWYSRCAFIRVFAFKWYLKNTQWSLPSQLSIQTKPLAIQEPSALMHVDPNNSFGAARDEMHNGGLSKAESAVNNSKVVGNYHRVASILPYYSCNYEKNNNNNVCLVFYSNFGDDKEVDFPILL